MSDSRKEFEALPEIKRRLMSVRFNEDINEYEPVNVMLTECVAVTLFINGAWFEFQEQQKKIDELKGIIKIQECVVDAIKKTLNEIYDACDEDETVSMLLDKIQELLK